MPLTVYNTQNRCQEAFKTIEPGKVKMYCCGVTVYDYCHLGHARSYIVWDVVRRYLKWQGYEVEYVQNFTDIDDKIINRAKRDNLAPEEVSQRYIKEYFADLRRLNVRDADEYPQATEHIAGMQQLIENLIAQDLAYGAGGDVYYRVEKFPSYGKLSGRKLDQMQAGASGRVDVPEVGEVKKQHPFDFALWKASKRSEPSWDSPWGKGRPGWHIECSAMVKALLGETIDIHSGGGDLVFPHHENEIAQSEGATKQPLANYWLHNGMVMVEGQKMSKSLGNFTTIRELLNRPVEPMVVRLFVLQAQYRKPLDFTDEAIASAKNSWETWQAGLLFGQQYGEKLGFQEKDLQVEDSYKSRFTEAMNNDFNTPKAMAVLFELAKELRRQTNLIIHEGEADASTKVLVKQWHTLVELAAVLGLEVVNEQKETPQSNETQIQTLVKQRQQARRDRNFAEADQIRDQLQAMGIGLIDQPDGETRTIKLK
ncbi:MAG: cysteine--tRNA ligase [Spirulinaceae cyanobacterium]